MCQGQDFLIKEFVFFFWQLLFKGALVDGGWQLLDDVGKSTGGEKSQELVRTIQPNVIKRGEVPNMGDK